MEPTPAPPELWTRIRAKTAQATRPSVEAVPVSVIRIMKLLSAAAAAALVLVVLGSSSDHPSSRASEPIETALVSVEDDESVVDLTAGMLMSAKSR